MCIRDRPADGPALSRCVPALEAEHHGDAQAVDLAVQKFQTFFKPVHLFFVGLPVHGLLKIHAGEDAVFQRDVYKRQYYPCK